jgi:hypothetical protein
MIGAVIPFLPFMIFVDGAPIDKYPVLGGLAFAASIGFAVYGGCEHCGLIKLFM